MMTRKRLSVKNVGINALEMLAEIRIVERRQVAAILEDSIEMYWHEVFGEAEEDLDEAA